MGYIKKLKNNELVGGTDKHTIYPVTSTEAVFEEITNGNESSFKSQKTINKEQQDELDDHEERIQAAEAEDIKSITINGSTKKFEVDDENNVDLTIYTVDSDPEMPDIADKVRELRDVVGTSTPVLETSHKTRIENLETTVGTGGTVDSRIATTKAELEEQIAGKQKTLSVGSGITLTSEGVISATADPSVAKVVEALPTGDDIVNGLIYLVKTNTAGTYSQHVHSTSGWSSNLPNVSLGITADDAIDSTSTNPIQNDAITAQIGYFVCGDSNGSSATKNVDAPSYSPSDVGGAFKIKMNYANTSTDTVYLRFNSDDTTKKELRYNREPVTPTNTWDSPEVISVYYDGTYYQASNAQGGGSAVGKKRIIGGVGFINTTNVATQGQIPTPTRINTNYNCIKYPVSAGDVLQITGRGGGNTASLLYAFGDTSNNYISGAPATLVAKDLVLVVPEGAVWVVLNSSIINGNTYEWYHAKAGSMGAHEIFTECYIYGDLETLALGQTYEAGTAIKTTDKQLRKTTKEIKDLSLSEALAIGDVRIIDGTTYRAASAINTFNPNTTYADGAYALGSMAVYTLTVTADTVAAGNITVNGTKVAIAATDDAAAIATKISAALSINGWFDSVNSNVITVICNTIGDNTIDISIDAGSTGVVVEGVSTPSVEGTNNIRKYDGSDWEDATAEGMIEDGVLVIADEKWLIANASSQNSVTKDLQGVKENEVIEKVEDINNHPDLILEKQPVDLTLYPEQDCSLGSNDKWYYNGSAYGKHKAIEVTSGEIIGINISGFSNGFYGWMTSSYNPPYQSYDNVPYLYNGTGSKRTLYRSDELQYLTVPEGAKYLVICTVDGGNNRVNWEVVKHKSEYRHSNFVKLRVAHWNIGHFATGSGSSTSITPENYDEMSAKYKQVINDVGADIFGFAEYDPVFCTDGKLAKDVIFQCYSNIYEGSRPDNYNCNTIMFNGLKYIADRQVYYTAHTQKRYAKIVDVLINGRPVRIVETHWDFNASPGVDAADIKRSQAIQLLNLVKDCEYVIIEGDLNTYDTSQSHAHKEKDAATLQMFKDAGFEFVNNGYLAPFTTATNGGSVDHIMTKGFAMSNRQRVDVSGTLSDHYAIYCDLVMNF